MEDTIRLTPATETDDGVLGPAVVGVGASAGGLEAIREFFSSFGGETGLAFVVIQHLDPTHESLMAELIERYTPMAVRQAAGGERLEPNQVYVIPPGNGLAIEDGVLRLTDFVDPRGLRRPIDDFFESLALDRGPRAACVILSGTGADGSRGLRAIKDSGGLCAAQDPVTARYDGMPLSAIGTGLVDVVAPPGDIIDALRTFFDRAVPGQTEAQATSIADHIEPICEAVRAAIGHDFSGYKRPTLSRRIARRMHVLGIDEASAYLDRVRADKDEAVCLFRDLLINVTRFFRDPSAFEAIATKVIDPLVRDARDGEELRVWVAGCSSGEEAYTFAMLFADAMERFGTRPWVQVFATDIDDKMIALGRRAEYPLAALGDIPIALRDRYVIAGPASFTLAPQVREMVRFSIHSLIKDPPFVKIALASCRNLLIYFDDRLQKAVLPLFHFALREGGHLLLGSSETIGRFDDLFDTVDQTARIFLRRSVPARYALVLPGSDDRPRPQALTRLRAGAGPAEPTLELQALRRLAQAYGPAGLLLGPDGSLIDKWGRVGRYLEFPDQFSRMPHVLSLARPGLREALGALLRDSRQEGRRVIARGVLVHTEFGVLPCSVLCEPLGERAVLVVIRDEGPIAPEPADGFVEVDAGEGQVRFLEEELLAARHRLRSATEELETTNEELKSSNEEMMSMNEELQSTNEELTTVNDELKTKVDQVTVANADLKNFFESTGLLVLVMDEQLRLRTWTDAAAEVFDLSPSARGRYLAEIRTQLADAAPLSQLAERATRSQTGEAWVQTEDGTRSFIARALPYRNLDGSTGGATVVLTDVTRSLLLERDLEEERERLRLALEVARIGVWTYDPTSDAVDLDDTERELLGIDAEDPGDLMDPILSRLRPSDRDRINGSLRRAMDGLSDFDEVFPIDRPDGATHWLRGLGRRMEGTRQRKFIGVTYDITAERAQLAERELMIREMNHRVKNLFAVISGMVGISAREATGIEELVDRLRARIGALGRSHNLVTNGPDVAAPPLQSFVETVIAPSLGGQSVELAGPEIGVRDRQVTPLALILHEWATNAAKYGGLSVPDGTLSVTWAREGDRVVVNWTETAPSAGTDALDDRPPEGFGSRLVELSARQMEGTVEGGRVPGGFVRRLVYPA